MRFMTMLLLCCYAVVAWAAPLQVDALTMRWKEKPTPPWTGNWSSGAIKMPYVRATDPQVAARINDWLFLERIGMPMPQNPDKTFTLPADIMPEGLASQSFKVERNDGRVLTLTFNAEGCGAYCEEYQSTYSFDAATGRNLAAADVLTRQGLLQVVQRMQRERIARYRKEIALLQRQQKAAARKTKPGQADVEGWQEMIAFNQDCLARETDSDHQVTLDRLDFYQFSPLEKGFVFTSERCSAHVNRALDGVMEVALLLPNADLAPWLTAYGKALQLGVGTSDSPVSPQGQVLHGKLGGAAITLWMHRPYADGSFSGLYYYDRYRKPIEISASRQGKQWELIETVPGQTESSGQSSSAVFKLTETPNGFKGLWQGNGKAYPVEVAW